MTLTDRAAEDPKVSERGHGFAVVLDASGISRGVGFLVLDGVLLTCAHVVEAAGVRPGETLQLAFPRLPGSPRTTGWVDPEGWHPQEDVALVRLSEVPAGSDPFLLGSASGCRGHRVSGFGVPDGGLRGRFGYARAGDVLPDTDGRGHLLQLAEANDVTAGFSGSPVVDEVTGLVVGMITAIDRVDTYQRGAGVAYATAVETLRQLIPSLSLQATCPYRGLAPFELEHAAWFHGRGVAVQQVVDALARRAVLLLGPSGSGKSSLVHAGVLAEIGAGKTLPNSGRWRVISARPAQDLIAELDQAGLTGARSQGLAAAVRAQTATLPAGERLLLIIDQLEEIFTHQPGTWEPLRELDEVICSTSAVTVLLVMRDDFYAQLASASPELLRSLLPGVTNIPATIARTEIEEIITRPADSVGLRFEPGLVDQLVADLEALSGDAGERHVPITLLPVLELALMQLWENCVDGRLTHDGYQRAGRLPGGLTSRCDHSIAVLDIPHQHIARKLLTALVRPADPEQNIAPARRQVPLDELRELATSNDQHDRATVDVVLRALTTTTPLIVTHTRPGRPDAPPVAELIHDSLIRDWASLRDWVHQDSQFHDWLRRTEEQRRHWAAGNNTADLLRGSLLTDGLDWSRQRRLPAVITAFVHTSDRAATGRVRRTRLMVATMAVLLAIALGTAGVVFTQQQRSVEARQTALSRQLAAQSQTVASTYSDLSELLAAYAYRAGPTNDAHNALHTAYATNLPLRRTIYGHTGLVGSVAFSPDGKTLASASFDKTVKLWNAVTGEVDRILIGHTGPVNSVVFSPDGETVASAGIDKTVRLWNAVTGEVDRILVGHTGLVGSVAFSPDGKTLASAGTDGTVRFWNAVTGEVDRTLVGHTGPVNSVVFSPDGETVASAGIDKTVRLWNAATGSEERTLIGHADWARSVTFSPDGRTLASAGEDQTVRLWNVATGAEERVLTGSNRAALAVAFSPDGKILASARDEGTIQLWDVATGAGLRNLTRNKNAAYSVAFSPDGKTLASSSSDNTIRLWDPAAGNELRTLTGHAETIFSVQFSPDGRMLASSSGDNTVQLWNAATGDKIRTLAGHTGPVGTAVFSPDGETLASSSSDKTVRLWNAGTGKALRTLTGHTASSYSVVFSPDGRTLASSSSDKTVRLWNAATGDEIRTLIGHVDWVYSAAFSPDSRRLASASNDLNIRLWNAVTGVEIRSLTGHTGPVNSVAFSPDGRILASGGGDNTVRFWNSVTGDKIRTLIGHTGPVFSVAFSPDGRILASAGRDNTVRLWNASTGDRIRTLIGHTGSVNSVVFSPDGKTLASAGRDNTIRLWGMRPPAPKRMIEQICTSIGHDVDANDLVAYSLGDSVEPACTR